MLHDGMIRHTPALAAAITSAEFPQWDHGRIVRRLALGKREKVGRGLCAGVGVAPYGYRYEYDERGKQSRLVPDPARAPIVRRIFRDIVHLSLAQLCAAPNADGIPTMRPDRASTGSYQTTIAQMVRNPVYRGQAAYGRRLGRPRPRPIPPGGCM